MQFSSYMRSMLKINPHIPMIRFRKGQKDLGHEKIQPSSTVTASVAARSSALAFDDFNLPLRFRRILIHQDEIDIVNSGGCPPDIVEKKKK